MKIRVNNEEHQLSSDNCTLTDILRDKNIFAEKGVAVAVNNEIISKSSWDRHVLRENDNLLIITAAQGG